MMTNDEIINKIIQQMPLASASINICDAATRAAKAALSFKDNQPKKPSCVKICSEKVFDSYEECADDLVKYCLTN